MHIILLGPPGGGKGTQATRITEHYKIAHVSSGNIIRDTIKSDPQIKAQYATCIQTGRLIPDELMTELLERYIDSLKTAGGETGGFLLDGFPRTLKQAKQLSIILKKKRINIAHVIHIDVPDDEIITRLLKRASIENRTDDTKESITKRIEIYHHHIDSLRRFYKEEHMYFWSISGVGPIESITEAILSKIQQNKQCTI